jgi:hypothetical protein
LDGIAFLLSQQGIRFSQFLSVQIGSQEIMNPKYAC